MCVRKCVNVWACVCICVQLVKLSSVFDYMFEHNYIKKKIEIRKKNKNKQQGVCVYNPVLNTFQPWSWRNWRIKTRTYVTNQIPYSKQLTVILLFESLLYSTKNPVQLRANDNTFKNLLSQPKLQWHVQHGIYL